jgi:polysaccharide pyruvyl transferase WcaK-like protein
MNRIILFGFWGSGNIGNDATLEATLYHVKKHQPVATVICVCNGPHEVSRRFGIEALPMTEHEADKQDSGGLSSRIIRLWLRMKDEVLFWLKRPGWFQPGDKFIVAGSGGADDYNVRRPWHRPYVLYKWCKAAKMGGAQVYFLSTGAGPLLNPVSRFLMLKALRMADYRSYREAAAFNYLQSIGYDTTEDLSYPDLVFSLPKPILPIPKVSTTPAVVGLGLMWHLGHKYKAGTGDMIYQEYIAKIKHFAYWLLQEGYTIRLLIGDIADKWPSQNLIEFLDKEGKSNWREKFIVEEIANVHELSHQIAQTDLVIASRFHNVVCGLMLERPVISLSYHEKNDSLMKEMGLERYCQPIEHFTNERLVKQFNSCIDEADQIAHQIHVQLNNYRNLLDEQYRMLLSQPQAIRLTEHAQLF